MPINPHLQPVLRRLFREYPESVRRVVSVLGERGGQFTSASDVAATAGIRDRDRLNQMLARGGLPSLTALARLIRVLNWSLEFEYRSMTLAALAKDEDRYLAHCSRDVRKALGVSWSTLKELGSEWVVERIREQIA